MDDAHFGPPSLDRRRHGELLLPIRGGLRRSRKRDYGDNFAADSRYGRRPDAAAMPRDVGQC